MTVIEKNDVDISKLFHYGDEFVVTGQGTDTSTVFMRLVGDAEINRARIFAIRKSAELRKRLRTPDSDERIAFIPSLEDITKEELIQILVKYALSDFAREAIKEVAMIYPKEPSSDEPLEKHEQYQEIVDNFEKERNAKATLQCCREQTCGTVRGAAGQPRGKPQLRPNTPQEERTQREHPPCKKYSARATE